MEKQKVATEVAKQELSRWAETLDLRVSMDELVEDENGSLILRAIERGALVINERGQAVFTARDDMEPLTFFEPKGEVVLGSKPGATDAQRTADMVVSMTGTPIQRFKEMPFRDYKVCAALASLLLAAR